MLRVIVTLAVVGSAAAMSPTVEIAPGVSMPRINLGTCCGSERCETESGSREQ